MEEEKYVDLLFVQDGPDRRVVEVPTRILVDVGDLVEYVEEENGVLITRMGLVLKAMFCERYGNEWSCIAELTQIREGKHVWKPAWSRPEPEEA